VKRILPIPQHHVHSFIYTLKTSRKPLISSPSSLTLHPLSKPRPCRNTAAHHIVARVLHSKSHVQTTTTTTAERNGNRERGPSKKQTNNPLPQKYDDHLDYDEREVCDSWRGSFWRRRSAGRRGAHSDDGCCGGEGGSGSGWWVGIRGEKLFARRRRGAPSSSLGNVVTRRQQRRQRRQARPRGRRC
jgi:hypothetical protein